MSRYLRASLSVEPFFARSTSSAISRLSASPSQTPRTTTFSPPLSAVQSVLPSRLLLAAMRPEAAARMWLVER